MDNAAAVVQKPRGMDLSRRSANFIASALLASLVYIAWTAAWVSFDATPTSRPGMGGALAFSVIFWLTSGFGLAMLLMIVPWAVAVWVQRKMGWNGRIYFPAAGAVLVFVLGCVATSLSPKLLIVEDQTFMQGALVTAQRQGLCLAVCGIVFGVCYWWLDRRASSKRVE